MSVEDDLKKADDFFRVGAEVYRAANKPIPLEKLGLSDTRPADVVATRQRRDEVTYETLSPAERTKLLEENPEEWRRLLDASNREGDRKLFNSPGNRPRY